MILVMRRMNWTNWSVIYLFLVRFITWLTGVLSQNTYIRNRGYNFLIPIGRTLTQQEEKNDADDDSDDSDSGQSGNPTSPVDDGENESNADLDASMEDLDDETGDLTAETEDADELGEGDTEFEEEPSDT